MCTRNTRQAFQAHCSRSGDRGNLPRKTCLSYKERSIYMRVSACRDGFLFASVASLALRKVYIMQICKKNKVHSSQ